MVNRVSNRYTSASPEHMKVSTVTNEILRRFRTTSRDLPVSEMEGVLMRYMDDLRHEGYGLEWRKKVLEAACTGYDRMWNAEVEGGR